MNNPNLKGHLIEIAVGTSLLMDPEMQVYYWREKNKEVDFVVRTKQKLIAIEVKSGRKKLTYLVLLNLKKHSHRLTQFW